MKTFTKKMILSVAAALLLSMFSTFAGDITIGTKGSSVGAVDVGNQTWTSGSTVTVYDHMIIPVGKSLTIQEGVNVQIADTTLKVEMIPVDHSLPGSCAFVVYTDEGNLVYTGDLRFHGNNKELSRKFVEKVKAVLGQ